MTSFEKGIKAEHRVREFLCAQGYQCLAHRFKTAWGEIDLIMVQEKTLCLVEVKWRRHSSEGLWALTPKQWIRINQAGAFFLAQHSSLKWSQVRIDLAVVSPSHSLDYFENIMP